MSFFYVIKTKIFAGSDVLLYEVTSIYCSRCKEFSPIFDAVNYDFSATEIICSNCGKILLLMKTKYQTNVDMNFKSSRIENYVRRENQKTSKRVKIKNMYAGVNTA
jgi:hypothetical protein